MKPITKLQIFLLALGLGYGPSHIAMDREQPVESREITEEKLKQETSQQRAERQQKEKFELTSEINKEKDKAGDGYPSKDLLSSGSQARYKDLGGLPLLEQIHDLRLSLLNKKHLKENQIGTKDTTQQKAAKKSTTTLVDELGDLDDQQQNQPSNTENSTTVFSDEDNSDNNNNNNNTETTPTNQPQPSHSSQRNTWFKTTSQKIVEYIMDNPNTNSQSNLAQLKKELLSSSLRSKGARIDNILKIVNENPDSPQAKEIVDALNDREILTNTRVEKQGDGTWKRVDSVFNMDKARDIVKTLSHLDPESSNEEIQEKVKTLQKDLKQELTKQTAATPKEIEKLFNDYLSNARKGRLEGKTSSKIVESEEIKKMTTIFKSALPEGDSITIGEDGKLTIRKKGSSELETTRLLNAYKTLGFTTKIFNRQDITTQEIVDAYKANPTPEMQQAYDRIMNQRKNVANATTMTPERAESTLGINPDTTPTASIIIKAFDNARQKFPDKNYLPDKYFENAKNTLLNKLSPTQVLSLDLEKQPFTFEQVFDKFTTLKKDTKIPEQDLQKAVKDIVTSTNAYAMLGFKKSEIPDITVNEVNSEINILRDKFNDNPLTTEMLDKITSRIIDDVTKREESKGKAKQQAFNSIKSSLEELGLKNITSSDLDTMTDDALTNKYNEQENKINQLPSNESRSITQKRLNNALYKVKAYRQEAQRNQWDKVKIDKPTTLSDDNNNNNFVTVQKDQPALAPAPPQPITGQVVNDDYVPPNDISTLQNNQVPTGYTGYNTN